jgi:hypothetical protein
MYTIIQMYFYYFFFTMFISSIMAQTCPVRCPACTMCDPKKGTCIVPRDFVRCTKSGVAGVCFAGTCNTKLSIPVSPVPKCQTYRCPASGQCSLITAPDGSDCTPNNVEYESVCLSGTCNRVWLGVTDVFPMQNTGCVGKPNGAVCDTNHVFTDGETCQGGVCQFPDGTYYGYVPGVV